MNEKHLISFLDFGTEIRIETGSTILEAMVQAGIHADAPCGGHGTCGKCVVDILAADGAWHSACACQTQVNADLQIRLPQKGAELRVLQQGQAQKSTPWKPWVRALHLHIDRSVAKFDSAWSHIQRALEKETNACGWTIRIETVNHLVALEQSRPTELWAVVNQRQEVLDILADQPSIHMVAFDLGTTSVAGYLLDANAQQCLHTAGCINPQIQFGADVVSRIDYALQNGSKAVSNCVREALNRLMGELCAAAGISEKSVYATCVVGNTGMHHLFLNISTAALARAPYNPAISDALLLKAADFGLQTHPNADLLLPPVIAGYVGADTVACMVSDNRSEQQKNILLIDIGTNGEIVLKSGKRRLACSTAAGPAFEGARIQCGMRGVDGAVDRVWLHGENIHWHVIGEGPARGLCGSGLVDWIAVLLQTGAIDESGRLVQGEHCRLGNTDVILTQRDIREVQLAKAAISAGIQIMAQELKMAVEAIDEVHIAGAFGNYLNADSACAIGLIPNVLRKKIIKIGNAAGEGAKLVLQDYSAWDSAQKLAQETEFLELASVRAFQDIFVDALDFPEEAKSCDLKN